MIPYLRQFRAVTRWKPFDTSTPAGRSDERYRRIVLTTVSGMTVRGAGLLAGLITVPLLLGYLGKEKYGLWTAITSIVTWAALFDLGLSNGLVNLVSRAHGRDDEAEARGAFATAFVALSIIALVLAAVVAIAVPQLSWSSFLGAHGLMAENTIRWSVATALGTFLLGLPLATIPQAYAGYQKAYIVNAFGLIGTIVSSVILIGAIVLESAMPVLVLCLASGGLISTSLALAYAPRALPWIRLHAAHASRQAFRELTARSVPIFLFQLGALAVNETQVIILARRSGLSVVTEYSLAFRLYAVILSLIQLGTGSFLPPLREAHERGDRPWATRAFRNLRLLRVTMAIAGGLGLMSLGNLVLRVWLRRSDIEFGLDVWGALAGMMVAAAWATVYSEYLWIMDRLWPLVGMVLVNGVVTVGLTWTLAPTHAVLGAVIASMAFTLLVSSWALPWMARPLLGSGPGPGQHAGENQGAQTP